MALENWLTGAVKTQRRPRAPGRIEIAAREFERHLRGLASDAWCTALYPRYHGLNGGEKGIRTLETVPRLHTFQACAFDHSAISPQAIGGVARGDRPSESARNIPIGALAARPIAPAGAAYHNRVTFVAFRRRAPIFQIIAPHAKRSAIVPIGPPGRSGRDGKTACGSSCASWVPGSSPWR